MKLKSIKKSFLKSLRKYKLNKVDLNKNDILPKWWEIIPKDFRDNCVYKSVPNWPLSKDAKKLRAIYTEKFGEEVIKKRVPILNWKRADICASIVPHNMNLVDIGSGLGEFINLRALKFRNSETSSIDLKDWDCFFLNSSRIKRSYKDIFNLTQENSHEIVTCFEVIEHLPPEKLTAAVNILRSIAKKRLYISVPFYEPMPLYKGHFTRFTKENLLQLFPDAQFTVFGKNDHSEDKVYAWILCEIHIN